MDGIVVGPKFFETYMPITLDEYCNPALPQTILAFRNKDQVLGRHERFIRENMVSAKELDKGEQALLGELWVLARACARKFMGFGNPTTLRRLKNLSGNFPEQVVLVSQACIWLIGDKAISYNPSDVAFELNEIEWHQLRKYHPYLFITLALGKLVERFDLPRQGSEGPILRTYENALVALSEEVNQYTKNALVEEIDLDQEKALFHQISDLREELSMVKSILASQEEVWNEYMNVVESKSKPNKPLNVDSFEATVIKRLGLEGTEREVTARQNRRTRAKLSKYNRRIAKIEQDAERVEHNISTKLELKQKHATIKEAHSTAILSATVFGFTIITVIFAPLSFVVALFALPIDKFKEGKYGNDDFFSSSYIGKWVVTTEFVSIFITLVAMWAALRFADLHIWGKKGLRESIRRKANEIRTEQRQRKHAVGDTFSSGSVDLEQGNRQT
ncbi:hypothetical protein F4679DRAFT_575734 [Xylaria curta]|nr:hypothetical protein F4679DRAFT_575734 [Xylaria curta]